MFGSSFGLSIVHTVHFTPLLACFVNTVVFPSHGAGWAPVSGARDGGGGGVCAERRGRRKEGTILILILT